MYVWAWICTDGMRASRLQAKCQWCYLSQKNWSGDCQVNWTCSAALEWSYFSAMFQWCLITIASTANCNLHYISLHYCSNHRPNWLKLAEASHLVVREDLQTSLLLVRIQLQLPFYRPPFSSQLQTVRMLEWFLLFTIAECSSQP